MGGGRGGPPCCSPYLCPPRCHCPCHLLPQIHGLPTLIFIGMDASKPALRTEGLLPAQASTAASWWLPACLPGCWCLDARAPLHELSPML